MRELKEIKQKILEYTGAEDIKCAKKYEELAVRMVYRSPKLIEKIKQLYSKPNLKSKVIKIQKARPWSNKSWSTKTILEHDSVNDLVLFVNSKRYIICNLDNDDESNSNPYHEVDFYDHIPEELKQFIPKKLKKVNNEVKTHQIKL